MVYIIFEGLDNSGKTTAIAKLVNKLSRDGRNVKSIRFPDRTTLLGHKIDTLLKEGGGDVHETIHQLCQQQIKDSIPELLSYPKDDIIIIDRFICSNYAYSPSGHDESELVFDIYNKLNNYSKVISIYMDIPPFISIRRSNSFGDQDKEFYDSVEKQSLIFKRYGYIFSILNQYYSIHNTCAVSSFNIVDTNIYNYIQKYI